MIEFFQNIWTSLITPNEQLTNILVSTPLVLLDAYVGMLLFTTILNIKSNTKQKVLYVCSLSTISFLSRIFIPNPFATYVNIIALPLLVITIFKTSILKGIVSEILPLITTVLLESVFVNLYLTLFNISHDTALYTPLYRLIIMLSIYFVIYLIYRFAKYLKLNITLLDSMNKRDKILLSLNFILAIVFICAQLYLTTFYSNTLPLMITLLSVLALISFFIISIYNLIKTTQLAITTRDLEESKLYNKTLTILHDNIRCFKHDFSNIVQAIGGYIQTDDMVGLKKYYTQLLGDCQKVSNLNVLNPEVINNPAIYSLITSKYHLAEENGISFHVDFFFDLKTLNMKEYEFARIIGILLDNAIEAAKECDEKVVNVCMRVDTKANRQIFYIENTYANKDIDTEKIYEKAYSTKANNTGLGLWEVRKILSKNNNLNLYTTKDDKFFKQQLEIYL